MATETTQTNKYYTIKTFCKELGFMTEPSIRYQIFHADENRMNEFKVLKRIGKKILIDFSAFELWLSAINQQGGNK